MSRKPAVKYLKHTFFSLVDLEDFYSTPRAQVKGHVKIFKIVFFRIEIKKIAFSLSQIKRMR